MENQYSNKMKFNLVRTSASGRGCTTKSHIKFDSNTLLRVAMKGICNVVNRHIQSGSIIDKDHLQELEQDNIIRWYRTEISKATRHYPKSIPKELKDMCEELIPDLKDKTNKLIFTSKRKARPVRSMKSSEKMLKLYNKSLCKMINYKYIYTGRREMWLARMAESGDSSVEITIIAIIRNQPP